MIDSGMYTDVIPYYIIRVWNMDDLANKNIKITKNITSIDSKRNYSTFLSFNRKHKKFIFPIPKDNLPIKFNLISTMDIETIILNDTHIPIAISIAYNYNEKRLFLIDYDLLVLDTEKAIIKLWEEYFNFIKNNNKYFKHIFYLPII